jgi:hypothetical protein
MPVSPERKVPTLRGEFISWIPHEFAKGIYMAGHARATQPETEHPIIAASLDEIGNELFEQVGMPLIQLSKLLMPNIEPHIPTPESQPETGALQSEVPALPAPQVQPATQMMMPSDQGEALPVSNAVAMDPATGAPNINAANAAIEQNIATPNTESGEASAAATAQTAQTPSTTATPHAADGANSAASPVTAAAETSTTANDSKASNPEKVA